MARNLVKEKESAQVTEEKAEVEQNQVQQPKVQVITFEQAMLQNQEAIMAEVLEIKLKVMQMAQQVGVVFPEDK